MISKKLQIYIANMTKPGPKAYQLIVAPEIDIHELQTVSLKSYKYDTALNGRITEEIKLQMKKAILKAKNDLNQFFNIQFKTIIDYLYLRCSMYKYFKALMQLRDDMKADTQQAQILEDLEGISFMGFMILVSKLVMDKKVYGSLLHQQGIPLPIFFKTTNQFVYQPQLCDLILGAKEFQLVLNVGSVGARQKGKSLLIAKIMNKKESQIANEFEDSFYLHTQPLLQASSKKKKQIMLMDFNGSISAGNPPQVKNMLKKSASVSALIIIHLTKDELLSEILKSNDFLQLFGQRKPKVILFLKDGIIKAKPTLIKLNTAEYQNVVPFNLFSQIVACNLPFSEHIRPQLWQTLNSLYGNVIPLITNTIFDSQGAQIPKLSLKSLYIENQEKKDLIKRIQQAVKPLLNRNFKKKNEAKYLYSVQLICKKMLESKRNKDTYVRSRLSQEIEAEKAKINIFPYSSFIMKSIDLILGGDIGKPLYTQVLNKAKKTVIDPIIISKASIESSKTQELDNLQLQIEEYNINMDDIVNQFVGSQRYSSKFSEGAKKAHDYYRKCYEEMSPLNIIDSNTLLFGNSNLQEFFKSVDIQFEDIFVVSIFGGQSSGKSTLLNYLFRSNFETSSGRCTKGVNISFCKIGQTLIVVLDTEGIMSIVARNEDFTLRIPTFVMMTSDLIIVTNTGQILEPFQKLMKDCLTILHKIRESQRQAGATTNSNNIHKMLIALKSLPIRQAGDNNIQDEFRTVLKYLRNLETTDKINYKDYIDLTADDIFSLPNLSESKQSPIDFIQQIELSTDDYGKAILSMRSSIKELIDSSHQRSTAMHLRSLKSLYQYLNIQWKVLYETDNLIQYKKNFSKKQEQQVAKICAENITQIKETIKENYHKISNNTQSKVDQDTFVRYIDDNEIKSMQDFKNIIRNLVPSFIQETYIEKSVQKFNQIYMDFVGEEIKKFKANKFLTEDGWKLQKLVQLQKSVLQTCMSYQNQGLFQKQISKSFEKFKAQASKVPFEPSPDKQKFGISYKNIFYERIIRKKGQLFGNTSVNQCIEIFQEIKADQRKIDEFIKPSDPQTTAQLDAFYPKFRDIFKRQLTGFESQLKFLLNAYSLEQVVDIMYKFRYINDEIEKRVKKLEIHAEVAVVDKQRIRCFFLGKVYEVTQQVFRTVKENQIIKRNRKIQEEIDKKVAFLSDKIKQVQENANKQLSQTLKSQSISFFNTLTPSRNDLILLASKLMENYFNDLTALYKPNKMLEKALKLTLLCPQEKAINSEDFFIDCYKIVKNPKRFIQQLLMNQSFYTLKNRNIDHIIEKVIQSQKERLLLKINIFQRIKDAETFKLALKNCNMISIYNKFQRIEGKSAEQLANEILDIMLKKLPSTEETMNNLLRKQQTISLLNKKWQENFKRLQSVAVGCDSRCPMCGIKCALPAGHSATSHSTLNGCHSLTAFGGCSLRATNEITTMLCQSEPTKKKIWKLKQIYHKNYHHLIKDLPDQWIQDFPLLETVSRYTNMIKNSSQLKIIWANIEKVMIITKFHDTNPTPDIEVTNVDRKNELSGIHLQSEVDTRLSQGKKILLRDY